MLFWCEVVGKMNCKGNFFHWCSWRYLDGLFKKTLWCFPNKILIIILVYLKSNQKMYGICFELNINSIAMKSYCRWKPTLLAIQVATWHGVTSLFPMNLEKFYSYIVQCCLWLARFQSFSVVPWLPVQFCLSQLLYLSLSSLFTM